MTMTPQQMRDEIAHLLQADVIGFGGAIACIEQMAELGFITAKQANRYTRNLGVHYTIDQTLRQLANGIITMHLDEAYNRVVEECA